MVGSISDRSAPAYPAATTAAARFAASATVSEHWRRRDVQAENMTS